MTGKTRYDYKLGRRCISPPVRTVCERTLAVSKYSLYFHPWCTCGNNCCPHQQCPLGSQARIAFWTCPLHRWLMRKTKLSWIGVAKFYDLNFSNYNIDPCCSLLTFTSRTVLPRMMKARSMVSIDQCISVLVLGPPALHVLDVSLPQQTWFNRMSCFSGA